MTGPYSKYGVSDPLDGTFVYAAPTPREPDLTEPYANPWRGPHFEPKPAAYELIADQGAKVAALRAAIKFAIKCLSTDAETATPVVEALKQALEDTE